MLPFYGHDRNNRLAKHGDREYFLFLILCFTITEFVFLFRFEILHTKNISEFGSAFVHALPVGDAALASEFALVAASGERMS